MYIKFLQVISKKSSCSGSSFDVVACSVHRCSGWIDRRHRGLFSVVYFGLITGTALHEVVHGIAHRKAAGRNGPQGF
ncbi:hypothetical protein PO124_29140 [Bacillus licheniformis]|nr:hypothetical protein [Bacillus licheniformis]